MINCFKTTTFCQLQHCRSCPKMIIYCMQGCKRSRHHRSNQCIMVSNALGGVNGRSRAVILHLDVDQYQQISLPDYLDDAQGACNCCAWSHQPNELRCSNQEIDKISFQGLNPSMLDEGLLDFFSMINTYQVVTLTSVVRMRSGDIIGLNLDHHSLTQNSVSRYSMRLSVMFCATFIS